MKVDRSVKISLNRKDMDRKQPSVSERGSQDLVLGSPDGEIWSIFPEVVVIPIRRMISRVLRDGEFPKPLALVASLRQEGVTYISRGLGTTMAEDLEATICVVELNWWWPSAAPAAFAQAGGLASVIAGKTDLDSAVLRTSRPNLFVLPAGSSPIEKRASMARSTVLHKVIADLQSRYDYLLLDVPAILACPDSIPLVSLGAACSLVIRQGATAMVDIRAALDDIDHIKQIGVIINQNRVNVSQFPFKYFVH